MSDCHDEHRRLARRDFYQNKLSERPLDGEIEAVGSADAAREFIMQWLWAGGKRFCPRCANKKLYDLKGGKLRCRGCGYTFTELTGRWINSCGLDAEDRIFLVRLFVEGYTAHQMTKITGLSYNAVFKALSAIRFAILSSSIDAFTLFGPETGLRQYIANKRIRSISRKNRILALPVFGIIENRGWVFVDLLPGFQCETVFHFYLNFHLSLGRTGNIIHTDPYRHYQTLVTCMDESLPYPASRSRQKPKIDNHPFNFWGYAQMQLKHFKGITPSRFPLYLKELEFRYNYRDKDLMPLVMHRFCAMVPELD